MTETGQTPDLSTLPGVNGAPALVDDAPRGPDEPVTPLDPVEPDALEPTGARPQPMARVRDQLGRLMPSPGAIDHMLTAPKAPEPPEIHAWRVKLYADLGGQSNLSAMQSLLVDEVCAVLLLAWVLDYRLRTVKKNRLDIIRERSQVATRLGRLLGQLGLERKGPKAATEMLAGYR